MSEHVAVRGFITSSDPVSFSIAHEYMFYEFDPIFLIVSSYAPYHKCNVDEYNIQLLS